MLTLGYILVCVLYQDAGNDMAEPAKREAELENLCREQAAKIEQLNYQVIIIFFSLYKS